MKTALSALLAFVLLQAQTPSSQGQLPTFRTGVDIVELDVTVLDKDRRPVKGLTADDFTILDRGKPQPIVAFSAVDVPAPVSYSAPWMRDAPIDVVSNVENRRLVAIVMDDAYTEFNPDFAKRAKQIAKNAVDELGPADLAAVTFTFLGQRQNFTSDRSKLLAAIDSFMPKSTPAGGPPIACALRSPKCDVQALSAAASTLLTAAPGRKVAILVSGGRSFVFGGPGDTENEAPELRQLFHDLQQANVTVYAFDARGLPAGGFSAENRRPTPIFPVELNESLHSFAESTGGRAITNTNDPQSHVAETFRESSSYYFIGFRTAVDSNEKGLRKVEVKVNLPGVRVQTRSGYYPPGKAKAGTPGEVINGLPSGDLPMHATAAVVAVPGRREAEVIVATRVDPHGASPETRTIELSAAAIDLDGKPRGVVRQTITVTPNSSSAVAPDLPAHLPLAPGRYVIQLSATTESRAGAAAVDVEVPDFAREPITASGLLLRRQPSPPIGDKAIAELVPFLPTTIRQFQKDDEVAVFVRIYQGGKGRIVPVRMTAKVTNEKNTATSSQEAMLDAENFSAARSADYQVTLPLAHLTPGQFLLEVEAQSGARRVKRSARFSVVK